jgi:hypothetical protein
MAIKLNHVKKPPKEEPQEDGQWEDVPPPKEKKKQWEKVPVPETPAPKKSASKSFGGFIKRGDAAKATLAQEEHKAKEREEANKNKVFRYYLPDDAEGKITFVDGDIVEGILDIPYYYEHNVLMGGKWNNFFICTQDTEPCPICQGGLVPSYVGVMTIIDHSKYQSKKDNKIYQDEVRLFVAKRHTLKQLQKIAVKRGGLRGVTFDVSRTGDKAASVGSDFDFVSKLTEKELIAKWGDKSTPLDYETLLKNQYLPASELKKLGFSSGQKAIGAEAASEDDYEGKL